MSKVYKGIERNIFFSVIFALFLPISRQSVEKERERYLFNFFQIKLFLRAEEWSVECTVWPDLAKFRHFGKILKAVGNFERAYLVLGKSLNLLWQILNDFWQTFIGLKGQILNKYSSHLVTLGVQLGGGWKNTFSDYLFRAEKVTTEKSKSWGVISNISMKTWQDSFHMRFRIQFSVFWYKCRI